MNPAPGGLGHVLGWPSRPRSARSGLALGQRVASLRCKPGRSSLSRSGELSARHVSSNAIERADRAATNPVLPSPRPGHGPARLQRLQDCGSPQSIWCCRPADSRLHLRVHHPVSRGLPEHGRNRSLNSATRPPCAAPARAGTAWRSDSGPTVSRCDWPSRWAAPAGSSPPILTLASWTDTAGRTWMSASTTS